MIRGLHLGFINPVGTGGVLDVCRGLGPGFRRAGWCSVCVSCESGLFMYIAGPDICILC